MRKGQNKSTQSFRVCLGRARRLGRRSASRQPRKKQENRGSGAPIAINPARFSKRQSWETGVVLSRASRDAECGRVFLPLLLPDVSGGAVFLTNAHHWLRKRERMVVTHTHTHTHSHTHKTMQRFSGSSHPPGSTCHRVSNRITTTERRRRQRVRRPLRSPQSQSPRLSL